MNWHNRRHAAVGTPSNAPVPVSPKKSAERVAQITKLPPLSTAPNKFEALAAHDAMVFSQTALSTRCGKHCSRLPTTFAYLGVRPVRAWRTGPAGERSRLHRSWPGKVQSDAVRKR